MADEQGAPSDFGGRVLPNPTGIKPVLGYGDRPQENGRRQRQEHTLALTTRPQPISGNTN